MIWRTKWSELVSDLREFQQRRRRLMGINFRNRALVSRVNPRRDRHLADDKLTTKRMLNEASVPTARTIASFSSLGEVPATLTLLMQHQSFVLKPARGAGGKGIIVVVGRSGPDFLQAGGKVITIAALRKHMAEIVFGAFSKAQEDRGLVEERIISHQIMREIGPMGLADIRVLVLHGRPFAAMVRVPTNKSSGKANLHAGGLGLGVDLQNGTVNRVMQSGRRLESHPDTGLLLLGRQIPHWPEVLDVAARAAKVFPLGYLGVDICLDHNLGPLVLEANVRPGLEIQNVCGITIPDALEVQ